MKIVTGILVAAAFLTLAACSPKQTATTNDTKPATTPTNTAAPAAPVEQKQEDTVTPIKKGETVTIQDFADITVTGNKISKKSNPLNRETSTHYTNPKQTPPSLL